MGSTLPFLLVGSLTLDELVESDDRLEEMARVDEMNGRFPEMAISYIGRSSTNVGSLTV